MERVAIKQFIEKGNLKKQGLQQYLRIVYLPATKYSNSILKPKLSIEVGKLIDAKTSKPASFRTDDREICLSIISGLACCFYLLGGDRRELYKHMLYLCSEEFYKEAMRKRKRR